MVRGDVAVHPHDVQNVVGVVIRVLLLFIGELYVAVKMVPLLAFADQRQDLIVEIDHVGASDLLIFGGAHSVAGIDDVRFHLDHPIERLDEPVVVKIGEIVEWQRSARLAHVHALQSLVGGEVSQQHPIRVAGRDVIDLDRFAAQREGHLVREDAVGNGGGKFIADDRLEGVLVRDRGCAGFLEYLRAANVVEMGMAEDHVLNGHVETRLDLIVQPLGVAGSSRVNYQDPFLGGQQETRVAAAWTSDPTVEIPFDLGYGVLRLVAGRDTRVGRDFS